MSNLLHLKSEFRCFEGTVAYYTHHSQCCNCEMSFAVFVPPQGRSRPLPVLYYLSGLTCTPENFTVKAGAQKYAAQYGLMLVAPDTSPRQTGTAGEEEDWDLGTGASFYVDATVAPWQKHYQMYSYITQELPQLIAANFPIIGSKQGIFGHSMGGHGALVCALRNPEKYSSVSAFAPITSPMNCAWGQKAFSHYLGADRDSWRAYDATESIAQQQFPGEILIDQGTQDNFLAQKQLLPERFAEACKAVGQPLKLRFQTGYDHSYFTIATFIEEHIQHHATILGA